MSKNTKKNSKKNIKKSKKQNIKKTKKISIRQKGGELDKTQESVQIEDKLFISRFLNTARDKNIFFDSTDDNKIKINNFLFQMYDKLDRDKLDKYYNSMKDKVVNTKINTESNILNEIEIMKINNEIKNTENNVLFSPKEDNGNKYMLTEVINEISRIKIFKIKIDNKSENFIIDLNGLVISDKNIDITNIKTIINKLNEKKDKHIINPFILQMFFQGTIGKISTKPLEKLINNCTGPDSIHKIITRTFIILDTPKQKIIRLELYMISLYNKALPVYIAQRSYIMADLYIRDDDDKFVENIINNNLFFGIDSSTQVPAANPSLAANPANPANPAANPTPLTGDNLKALKDKCNLIIVNILDKNIIEYCDSLKTVKP